jgi:hypothetical protein
LIFRRDGHCAYSEVMQWVDERPAPHCIRGLPRSYFKIRLTHQKMMALRQKA